MTPQIFTKLNAEWPSTFDEVSPAATALYALGDLACLRAPLCAVVGTRMATDYGVRVTTQLVSGLASAGVGIVSGLARGIDATAHRAALDAGGRTIAVLGTGIDVPYPASHRALHERIAVEGLVLSESPPGKKAFAGCFPRRNRLIAALAPVTLVVEAGFKSGAQSTANAALALGHTVAAVPGPIDSPQSAGTNALIAAGAQVVTCAGDLFALLGLNPPASEVVEASLDGDAKAVWRALEHDAQYFEDLTAVADLPMPRVLAAVSELELAGCIVVGFDDRVRRVLPVSRS